MTSCTSIANAFSRFQKLITELLNRFWSDTLFLITHFYARTIHTSLSLSLIHSENKPFLESSYLRISQLSYTLISFIWISDYTFPNILAFRPPPSTYIYIEIISLQTALSINKSSVVFFLYTSSTSISQSPVSETIVRFLGIHIYLAVTSSLVIYLCVSSKTD